MQSPRTLFIGALVAFILTLIAPPAQVMAQCDLNETTQLVASDAQANDWFGRGVAICDDIAVIGSTAGYVDRLGSGSAYVYRHNGSAWIEEAEISASDAATVGEPYPWFGASVSIDGETIVVGAPFDDHGNTMAGAGAAYVYRFDGESWLEEAKLVASDAEAGDKFGYCVSISGDVVACGAYLADLPGLTDAGAAYVFRHNGATWQEEAILAGSDTDSSDQFGWAVTVDDDWMIVGAPMAKVGTHRVGSAYVFHYENDTWSEDAKLATAIGSNMGYSVSLSNGVGIIGTPTPLGEGRAFVFSRAGGTWQAVDQLEAWDGHSDYQFGAAVSISGDVAIVGAVYDSATELGAGAGYVFHDTGSGWEGVAKLTASDASSDDGLGFPVSISGERAIFGAYHDHSGEYHSSYVLSGLTDCNGNAVFDACDIADGFSDDLNGDGVPDKCLPGDLNCDGRVDGDDIAPFVLAMVDVATYETTHPDCLRHNADIAPDDEYDLSDVAAFVESLFEG